MSNALQGMSAEAVQERQEARRIANARRERRNAIRNAYKDVEQFSMESIRFAQQAKQIYEEIQSKTGQAKYYAQKSQEATDAMFDKLGNLDNIDNPASDEDEETEPTEVETVCTGCLENQPNQMAHMDYGGCLYDA